MQGKGLGFVPGKVDERDFPLKASIDRIKQPKTHGSRWLQNPLRLDQGDTPQCVGHGWVQGINSQPKVHEYDHDFATSIYQRAQKLDDWPGEDYEGTSVRAGGKACRQANLIPSFAFSYDVEEIALWVLNKGPVIIGVDWRAGMEAPTKENDYYIEPTGAIRGGHCLAIDGVRWNGDDRDYFRLLNSWGPSFGADGRCKIRVPDLAFLLDRSSGVACTYVEAA